MINPTPDDIGRGVVYRAVPGFAPEQGIITSFNDDWVFVNYGSETYGVATRREDLEWLT